MHLAAALLPKTETFLSFNECQRKVAEAEGLKVRKLPPTQLPHNLFCETLLFQRPLFHCRDKVRFRSFQ